MTLIVFDPNEAERLIAERQANGHDRFDEVWEGVYLMNPSPNLEHQDLVGRLYGILFGLVSADFGNEVALGVNVSDRASDWTCNYRCPDVAVYLAGNPAKAFDAHWQGGPDLAIEIVSPRDRSREKIPFYESIGTRELWILDRDPWALEQFVLKDGRLVAQGVSTPADGAALASGVLPMRLRLVAGPKRPQVEVAALDEEKCWLA